MNHNHLILKKCLTCMIIIFKIIDMIGCDILTVYNILNYYCIQIKLIYKIKGKLSF